MSIDETVDIIHLIQAAYPSFKPQSIKDTVRIWQIVLSDVPYRFVEVALTMYIRTNNSGFAPVPGDIINQLNNISEYVSEEPTGMEAWAIVRETMLNATYNASEEFEKLPELIKRAVGSPSQLRAWAIDPSFTEGVAQSHFIRSYEALTKRKTELNKMPENVKKLIGEMKNEVTDGRLGDKGILQISKKSGFTD